MHKLVDQTELNNSSRCLKTINGNKYEIMKIPKHNTTEDIDQTKNYVNLLL